MNAQVQIAIARRRIFSERASSFLPTPRRHAQDWHFSAASGHKDIEPRIECVEDLTPQNTADRFLALGEDCDAVCLISAVHPLVTEAVETLQARGLPVSAFIGQLSAAGLVHDVGLDNWRVGRTAG